MFDWMQDHQWLVWTLTAASLVIFVGSLLALPAVVTRIQPDYFAHEERPPSRWRPKSPVVKTTAAIGRNVLGVLLMLAGIGMLVLPGQGLLAIFVGFFLIDVPGKYRVERWLVSRRPVLRTLNWLRRRAGRPPLRVA
jgi:hypothetical protein